LLNIIPFLLVAGAAYLQDVVNVFSIYIKERFFIAFYWLGITVSVLLYVPKPLRRVAPDNSLTDVSIFYQAADPAVVRAIHKGNSIYGVIGKGLNRRIYVAVVYNQGA
jgi:hypothetical protein